MALVEKQIVFKRKAKNGDVEMHFPVTRAEYVDGSVLTVNNVAPDADGNVSITSVTKATQDASGNTITSTYATKTELSGKANSSHSHAISDVTNLQTTLDAKAPLSSPTLTGTPKAPTATAGTNSTQIATTAFVTTAIANKTSVATATKATKDGSGNVITDTYATKTELNGKADSSHTHSISNITNLQSTLDAKATKTEVTNAISTAKSYTDTAVANLVDSAPDTLNTLGELATALQENEDVVETLNSAIGTKANSSEVVKLTGNQTIAGTKTFSSTITGSISGNAATATKATKDGSGNVITSTYATKTELSNGLSGKSDTGHTHSAATSSVLGMVKVGSNITNSSGTISLTKANVTDALGYTPPTTDTVYTHPSYTAKSSGLYKFTVDATGHVSATTAVTKADITGLGIPAQDTVYTLPNATSSVLGGVKVGSNITVSSGTISLTKSNVTSALGYTPSATDTSYNEATTTTSGLMSASDKAKLDGIAEGANKYTYTLPTAGSTLGGVKTTSTVTSTSGLTACPIIGGVPYYKDTNTTYSLSSFGVTATASELNVLDGITATTAELNYCDGVTSNIQTQLNGKLSTSGTAAKATADASGNNIVNTYATKVALNDKMNGSIHTVSERTRGSDEATYGLS